jgi:subtilisin family serine protease
MICFSFQFSLSFLATVSTFIYATPGRHHGAKVNGIGVPVSNSDASNIIANRYIVVYDNNATDDAVAVHQASVMSAMRKRSLEARSSSGRKLSNKMQAFSMSGWRGMTIDAEDSMILEIESASEVGPVFLTRSHDWHTNAKVAYVEADTIVKSTALLSQSNAPAGLGSISHKVAGNTSYVFDSSAGAGIVAYVVDTGIRTTHSVRRPISSTGFDDWLLRNSKVVQPGAPIWWTRLWVYPVLWCGHVLTLQNTDENGHGSHVSGTIAGATYGIAKSASLVAVKVLDGDGAGTTSGVIAGINFGQHRPSLDKLSPLTQQ